MRPPIDRRNMRRQSTNFKTVHTIYRAAFWVTVTFCTVALFVFIASIDSLI